jgi:ribonuclease HII
MNILGVDEAGRGSVLGPMVIAGVFGKKSYFKSNTFPDSKQLGKTDRSKKYEQLQDEVDVLSVKVPPSLIDEVTNLNYLEWRVMDSIMLSYDFEEGYVDAVGDSEEQKQFFIENSPLLHEDVKVESGADDRYDVVGASSIVAKEVRDRTIRELSVEYGDVGSGYPSDKKTQEWLQNNINDLPNFVRKSWSTIDKIKESVNG